MRLAFSITHGFQARMLLRSGIAERVRESGAEILILAPSANEPYFQGEFEHAQHRLVETTQQIGAVEKIVTSTRAYILKHPGLGDTLGLKQDRYQRAFPVRARATRLANGLFGRSARLRNGYSTLESRVFRGKEYDELLRVHRPDRVITGTPGYNTIDAHLLRSAHRHDIPTATVMLSWDNLTSKGQMAATPQRLLVWNQIMAREARAYHGYSGEVIEVGAAQFDVYWALSEEDRLAYRAALGIPRTAPLVVWGTINEDIYPRQVEEVEEYARRLQSARPEHHLWVRVHPQSVSGAHAHLVERYRTLASGHVHVEIPQVQSSTLRWDLPRADMTHLARLLRAADVVVTPQSTLSLDAACAGTPVINLALDQQFARTFEYTHYRNVVRTGGITIVASMRELFAAADAYIANRSLHTPARELSVHEQMGNFAGRAAKRTSDVLLADWSAPVDHAVAHRE